MKLEGDCTVSESEDSGGDTSSNDGAGAVVLVGVKLDSESKQLLTWALVKVARSGDRVIAIHVLNSDAEGKSTLLSLVKTFDSVLAAYEGFCNLKQVDLKLKVCRGSSVGKILVREAKSYGTANLIVGISKVRHTIWPSLLTAKYCARNLPKKFSVFAVDNGKILFKRQASEPKLRDSQDKNQNKSFVKSSSYSFRKEPKVLNNTMTHVEGQQRNPKNVNSADDGDEENLWALVPSNSQLLPDSKNGWALLRRVFLRNEQQSDKSSIKRTVMQWVLKLPRGHSLGAACPNHERRNSQECDDSPRSDGDNGAIALFQSDIALSPSFPRYSLSSFSEELKELTEKYSSVCKIFRYGEILLATSSFKPEFMVGKGGSSQVYRGCLPDGKELAVKVLKPSEDLFSQFISEIEIISNLHHKNTISLLGFCCEDNHLLFVYDYLSRGSLEENLHGNRKNGSTFRWEHRHKVALGVAQALDYLHNGADEPVIHRDVKSSNILLSDDFEPQLSDFGLAVRASDSLHYTTCTDVAGTFGYLAPEYFMHGKVNDRIDVYAFGVVLLELLSGRKPIDNANPKGQESLVMWATSIMKDGKALQLLDPSLNGNYNEDESERMMLAAVLCIRRAPLSRPQISLVLKLLQGDDEAVKWARQQVSSSEEADAVDGEDYSTNMQSHLDLAMLDLQEDSPSIGSSSYQSGSIEEYLKGRWSRTSSFD